MSLRLPDQALEVGAAAGQSPQVAPDAADRAGDLAGYGPVLFIGDLAEILCTSEATIRRRLRQHAFPIPELPRIDKSHRWSRAAVRSWLERPAAAGSRRGR